MSCQPLSQPQAPEEEELGRVSFSFITNSEWGGGTGRVASCTRCWPELQSQMPWKQQAACILLITFLGVSGPVGAVTRTYHIGIVEEYWDYVPQGKNVITGKSFAEDKWVSMGSPETPRFGFLVTDMWKVVLLGWWWWGWVDVNQQEGFCVCLESPIGVGVQFGRDILHSICLLNFLFKALSVKSHRQNQVLE